MPLVIGLAGLVAALALPFAPVWVRQTTVSWPNPSAPVVSSTAFFAPYRPTTLDVRVPCSVVSAAAARTGATTVLSTAAGGDGLLIRSVDGTVEVVTNRRLLTRAPVTGAGCGVRVDAGPDATTVTEGRRSVLRRGVSTPVVQSFHTDLDPASAAGLTVTAHTSSVFAERATPAKKALLWAWLGAAGLALGWVWWRTRAPVSDPERARGDPRAPPGRRAGVSLLVDAVVLAVLGAWAVIGPLSDDDGFAAMIARNSAAAGYQGNYYRWWNASEAPFALAQRVLAALTQLSASPLWLRLPSTVLAAVTWLVLSWGVLPALAPSATGFLARRWAVRALGAVCFLACWLPFNLGVRPEAYVALGTTAVLALLWRARSLRAVAAATVVAAITATASPVAVLLAAPGLVFAPKVARIVRAGTSSRWEVGARLAVLGCLAGTALALMFADQSGTAVRVATDWHNRFGPSLPWYDEYVRYRYLLGDDQDGSATKRIPVLLTLALLPLTGLLLALGVGQHAERPRWRRDAARLAVITALGLLLLWLTPSKWSHHFGALAGVFTAFLVAAVLLLVGRGGAELPGRSAGPGPAARRVDRLRPAVGLVAAGAVAAVASAGFSGPNAWWQPAVYDVPWSDGPVTPAGIPLNSPLLWVGLLAPAYLLVRARRRTGAVGGALITAPALIAVTAASVSVAVLLDSFVAAPLRQPSGSLALSNLHRLAGQPTCGLGDDIQVLPDVPRSVMAPSAIPANASADGGAQATGFRRGGGFDPAAPPPEPPGAGASTWLWGSRADGPATTGALTTGWFDLGRLTGDQEVTVSVAGRTDAGNFLALDFGHADPSDPAVTSLASRTPPDPLRHQSGQPPTYRLWRAVGVPAAQIPPGANRVRIHAVDATTGPDGWLAVTGPRLRHVVPLRQYLGQRGPVLIAWPIAFLFPCLITPASVHDGLAQAPTAVLEAPQRYSDLSAATTDPTIGGDFAPLRVPGRLGEVTTRLDHRPGTDWGNLLLTHYPAAIDAYRATTSWARVPGWRADTGIPEPPVRSAEP